MANDSNREHIISLILRGNMDTITHFSLLFFFVFLFLFLVIAPQDAVSNFFFPITIVPTLKLILSIV